MEEAAISERLLIQQVTMNLKQSQEAASLFGLPGSVATCSLSRGETSWPRLSSDDLEDVQITDSEPEDDVFLPNEESAQGLNLSRVKTINGVSLILPKQCVETLTSGAIAKDTRRDKTSMTCNSNPPTRNSKDFLLSELQGCGPFQEKCKDSFVTLCKESPKCRDDMHRSMETACIGHVLHQKNSCCHVWCCSCL